MEVLKEYSLNEQIFIVNAGIMVLKEIMPLYEKDDNQQEILLSKTLRKQIMELEGYLEEERESKRNITKREQELYCDKLEEYKLNSQKELTELIGFKEQEILRLKEVILQQQSQISQMPELYRSQYHSISIEKDSRISDLQQSIIDKNKQIEDKNMIIVEKNTIIEEYRKKEQDNIVEQTRSVTRGDIGEDYVISKLEEYWTRDWNICKTSKESASMDIKATNVLMNIKGGIEVKNFTNSVPKRDIDKFYRDIKERHDYDFGILISLNTSISSHRDFEIKLCPETKKPLIFIGNSEQQKDIYSLLETLVKSLIFNSRRDDSIDYSEILQEELNKNYKSYETISKHALSILDIAKKQMNESNIRSVEIFKKNLKDIKNNTKNKNISSQNQNMNLNIIERKLEFEIGSRLSLSDIIDFYNENEISNISSKKIINVIKGLILKNDWDSEYHNRKKEFSNLVLHL